MLEEELLAFGEGKRDGKPHQPSTEDSTIDSKETITCDSFYLSNNRSLLYAWVLDSSATFDMSPHRD